MQLPGQLKNTTLGDLLGALHRENASGVLELIEPDGRRHRVELREGEVEHVETDRGGPLLGDILGLGELPLSSDERRLGDELLDRGLVSTAELAEALRKQTLARLDCLFSIKSAAIRFHTPRPEADDPTSPRRLGQDEFLSGRPRHRARQSKEDVAEARRQSGALRVLGLSPGATAEDIRKAFREMAQKLHPDRHPNATADERHRLFRQFAEISRAYHSLTG